MPDDQNDKPRETVPEVEPHFPAVDAPRTTLPDLEPGDDGARRTEGERASSEVADAPPAAPNVGRSWMLFIIIGLLFMSVTGPLVFYFAVWRYRPTAVQHLPEGTALAVRFDGRELYQYEPFRKNIIEALDDATSTGGRAARFKKHTGIDLKSEVREIIYATTDGESWVVLLGGNFTAPRGTRERFGDKLLAFFDEEGVSGFTIDGAGVVHGRVHIAQASDSTIVIASSERGIDAALEPTETYKELALASSGAVSFVIDRPAWNDLSQNRMLSPFGFQKPFDHVKRGNGFLKIGREAKVYVDLEPAAGSSTEELASEWIEAQGKAKLGESSLPDFAGLTDAFFSAGIKPRAQSVMIEATWDRKRLDGLLVETGEWIREALAR